MAARLSGRPAPKKKGKGAKGGDKKGGDGGQKQPPQKSNNILLIVIAVLVFIGTVLAAANFVSNMLGPKEGETHANNPAEHEAVVGPTMDLGQFIVNLKDDQKIRGQGNKHSFLRTKITLSFAFKSDKYEKATQEEREKMDEELLEHYSNRVPLFKDTVVRVLSEKTSTELASIEGKNQVKAYIKTEINDKLKESQSVKEVFLTEFFIQ